MIICPNTTISNGKELAEKLRVNIENSHFETKKQESASFGIYQFQDADDITSFVNKADKALLNAKKNGRNRVEVFK